MLVQPPSAICRIKIPQQTSANRRKPRSRSVKSLRSGVIDSHQRMPSVVKPPSRWPVTISGFNSSVTVNAPSAPWTQTITNSAPTAASGWPRSRRFAVAQASSVMITNPKVVAK